MNERNNLPPNARQQPPEKVILVSYDAATDSFIQTPLMPTGSVPKVVSQSSVSPEIPEAPQNHPRFTEPFTHTTKMPFVNAENINVDSNASDEILVGDVVSSKEIPTRAQVARRWMGRIGAGTLIVGSGYLADVGTTYFQTGQIIGPMDVAQDVTELPGQLSQKAQGVGQFASDISNTINGLNNLKDNFTTEGGE